MKQEFMRTAIRLAEEKMLANEGGPFGAVIVRKNEIIGHGWNQVTSQNDPTAHAEVMAIRNACKKLGHFSLDDCEIYCSCEPCPMCLGAIYWARLQTIYYAGDSEDAASAGFDDDDFFGEFRKPSEERKIPSHQLLQEEAQNLFRLWQVKPGKTMY